MVTIIDAMHALVAVQEAIAITSPEPRTVKKAWPFVPPQNQVVTANMPCWTNAWDFVRETRHPSLRSLDYTVNMRLHVGQATAGDNAKIAELALAFLPAVLTAFGQKNGAGHGGITLAGVVSGAIVPTVTYQNIRGGSPTLGVFGDDVRTIGLDLFLDLQVSETFAYS